MQNQYFIFPNINPIIFSFGPISVHWYGIMYFLGFIFAIWLGSRRIHYLINFTKSDLKKLFCFIFIGIIFGGRIGYIIFYNLDILLKNPLNIFSIWLGGMSFHGGLLGVLIAIIIFSYKNKKNFFKITDFIVPLIPFGLGAGRIGNFINSELCGRISINSNWSILFPNYYIEDILVSKKDYILQKILYQYGALPRHPSQIYEFLLEGVMLFILLNFFILKIKKIGCLSGIFLFSYGIFRIFLEFFRQPDIQIGLYKNFCSMGQLLSIPMVIIGLSIIYLSYFNYFKKA